MTTLSWCHPQAGGSFLPAYQELESLGGGKWELMLKLGGDAPVLVFDPFGEPWLIPGMRGHSDTLSWYHPQVGHSFLPSSQEFASLGSEKHGGIWGDVPALC